jgi:hypothetical protein
MIDRRVISRRKVLCCVLTVPVLSAHSAGSTRIVIGSETIHLPAPDGFVTGPPADGQYLLDHVAPTHRTLEAFFPEGASPDPSTPATWPKRYLTASTLKRAEKRVVTSEFFGQLRVFMKSEYQRLLNQQAAQIGETAQRALDINSSITSASARNVRLLSTRVSEVLQENDTVVSFLLVSRWEVSEGGETRTLARPHGQSLLLLKGKVLYLSAYAEDLTEDSMSWVRSTTVSWPQLVVGAN